MTSEAPERQGGAWIGQHPDENTEQVRENLPENAERVAVTNNQSDDAPSDTSDAVREAGQDR